MSFYELLVVAIGGLAGYWLVGFLMKGRRSAPSSAQPADDTPAPPSETTMAPAPWHEVLNVAPQAGADEIREAYRRLMSQYHPDKVASLGPEIRELAHRKSQQIVAACEAGLRAREDGA